MILSPSGGILDLLCILNSSGFQINFRYVGGCSVICTVTMWRTFLDEMGQFSESSRNVNTG